MDLEHFATDRWSAPIGERVTFTEADLPPPPDRLRAAQLAVIGGQHDYGSVRVDSVLLVLSKQTAFRLGLVLLASVLGRQPRRIDLEILHPKSKVRSIVIAETLPNDPGLAERLRSFTFVPVPLRRHPWWPIGEGVSRFDLPQASLEKDDDDTDRYLSGFGTAQGCARLAGLLLTAAHPENKVLDFALEHEPGVVGVAPGSCELALILEGSSRYFLDD